MTFPKRSLLAFCLALPAFATPSALKLEDCLKIASDNQPTLAAAAASVSSAQESVGEARSPYFPQVNLDAGYHRLQKRAFLPSGFSFPGGSTPTQIGPLGDWTGGLSSRILLYDFGGRRAAVTSASALHAGAQAELEAARANVRLSVQNAFYALAAAMDIRTVAEKNVERSQVHLKLAQVRCRAGAVPVADELRVQAELASAQLDLANASAQVTIATGRLNAAMGRPAEDPLAIDPPSSIEAPAHVNLEALVARALASRPELRAAAKRAEAAKAQVDVARAARTPTISADASFGLNDTAWVPETKEWQAGISVDVPLFDGGARRHRVARSKAALSHEQALADAEALQVRQEVWAGVAERNRAWQAIALNEANVRASEESLRVVKERYENGAALISDLLDTQTMLARAEASLAEARWTYLAACASLDRALGSAQPSR